MKKLIVILFVLASADATAQLYREMMEDNSVNVYDVVKEAEKYFEAHDINEKGSGWKPYQRWLSKVEPLYFPSGDRESVDPLIAIHSYDQFVENAPSSLKHKTFDNGWKELGPYSAQRISSDTRRYPLGLGRIEDFYVNPNNSDSIYFVSRSGGFWKTTNGGQTWVGGSTDFLPASGVNRLTVNPNDPNEIFINVRNSENGFSHGIYHSTDAGDNWSLSLFNPTNVGYGGLGSNFIIDELIYHPYVDDLIFIGTNRGVYRSDDNLSSTGWTSLFTSNRILDINFHPTDGNIVYLYNVGIKNVVQVSLDQGISYTSSNPLAGNSDRNLYLSTSEDCANCLFVGSQNGVWKSIDNGQNFKFITNPPGDCRAFVVNDQDTSKWLYGYVGVHISQDGGRNWVLTTTGDEKSLQPNYIKVDMRMTDCVNGVFYCATDGLLSRTYNEGTSWEILTDSIGIREFYKLGVSQSNHYRTVGGSQDNGGSIKTEVEWIRFHGGDGMEGLFHPLNDDWIISGSQYGSRKRTTDGGITERDITPSSQERGHWIAPIAYDPNDQMTLYDFREHVYKTTDFGNTFDSIGTPTSFTNTIRKAAIAENNSNIMAISYHDHIDRSTDGGVTFTDIKANLPRAYIGDIAFDPNDDDVMIVTYSTYQDNGEKVFMTTNGGASWTNITYNLGNIPITAVVIDHTDSSNIYVGGEIGVYTKPMNGTVWVAYNSNLPNSSVSELDIVYGSNTLRAALWGRGFWEYTLVGRNNFPRIMTTSITDQPTEKAPREGFSQFVTSTIEYGNTLSKAWVEWSEDTAIFDGSNTIVMSNTSGNTWVSTSPLPSQVSGDDLFFKVYAVGNNADTTVTYKFMFETRDTLPLEILIGLTSGDDDVEEDPSGSLSFSSSDLELCADGSDKQFVGIHFREVSIPQGATIDSAYIEFQADESDDSSLEIIIKGDDADNSLAWDRSKLFDVSTRTQTADSVVWVHNSSTEWVGNVTVAQTPNLKNILQEIVNRPAWEIDNAMSFILYDQSPDTDKRVADSKNSGEGPKLFVKFTITHLPIELLDFSAVPQVQHVQLDWSTASEINNDYFTIERSENSEDWEFVVQVDGAGNSSDTLYYETKDENPILGRSYYRLKQTDFMGESSYSDIKIVDMSTLHYDNFERLKNPKIRIFPNPTRNLITINGDLHELEQVEIYNMLGINMSYSTKKINSDKSGIVLDLSGLKSGMYYLKTKTTAHKVYKQ